MLCAVCGWLSLCVWLWLCHTDDGSALHGKATQGSWSRPIQFADWAGKDRQSVCAMTTRSRTRHARACARHNNHTTDVLASLLLARVEATSVPEARSRTETQTHRHKPGHRHTSTATVVPVPARQPCAGPRAPARTQCGWQLPAPPPLCGGTWMPRPPRPACTAQL